MNNERELTNDELDAVSGGAGNPAFEIVDWGFGIDGGGGGLGGGGTKDPIGVWNTLLHQYGAA
jgi:bacteriocin-like protein